MTTLTALRWGFALVLLAAALWLSLLAAFGFGSYYLTDVGTDRLREQAPGLLVACVAGLAGMAAFLAIIGRRVASAWLLVGLAPAAVAAANHLGITG